jgi:hypothetical protein
MAGDTHMQSGKARTKGKNLRPAPPPPRGNQRAVKTGAQADGRNLSGYELTKHDVEEAIAAADWLRPSDGLLLDIFCRELHAYRHASDALARMTDAAYAKKLNAAKLCTRKARVLGELADRLGLSPQARFRLGLTVAKTEAAGRVMPVRTDERARAVAELLARSGALPPVPDAEVAEDATSPSDESGGHADASPQSDCAEYSAETLTTADQRAVFGPGDLTVPLSSPALQCEDEDE